MDGIRPEIETTQAPAPPRRMARYLGIWAASLGALLAAIIALCVTADPYAVIGTPGIRGLTMQKPAAADWPRVTKAYMVARQHPATIVLGNSAADVGFNPASAAWPAAWRPVFNLAIDGGLPITNLRFLQHALASTSPAHVVITINFLECLVFPPQPQAAATQNQFDFEPRMRVLADGTPNPHFAKARLADIIFSTLSFSAVHDSIETLLHQSDGNETYETASGWNDGGKFRRWAREDGAYGLFTNKDISNIEQYRRWEAAKRLDIDPVAQMVRLARARGADVTVAILPTHVDGLEIRRQMGLQADYDRWKTALVNSVAQAAPGGGVSIWDFSGYSPYMEEAVPNAGDHVHHFRWFWEPVHFQPELGDLMTARMTGSPSRDDFGVQLTQANLAAQIAAFHAGEASWVAAHKQDVARIAGLIAAAQ
jgi:hypothetical protein